MSADQSPSRRTILGVGAGIGAWLVSACARNPPGTAATPEVNQPAGSGASKAAPSSASPQASSATPTPSGTPTPSASATPSASVGLVDDPLPAGRPANVLIFGTDSRQPGSYSGNSDVMVFLQVSTDRKRVTLVSLPRDLWINQWPHSDGKINWALQRGGVDFLKKMVTSMVGVPIDYSMQTNFLSFIALTNLLDGFSVNNPIGSIAKGDGKIAMRNVPCPKGTLTLHGTDWLPFVRQRKELPLGDLDRTRRARAAVIGMGTWVRNKVVANPNYMATLVPQAVKNMQITGGLTNERLIKMAAVLKNIDPSQTINLMYPVSGFGNANGQSFVYFDKARGAEMKRGIQAGDLRPYVAKYGTSNAPTGGPRG